MKWKDQDDNENIWEPLEPFDQHAGHAGTVPPINKNTPMRRAMRCAVLTLPSHWTVTRTTPHGRNHRKPIIGTWPPIATLKFPSRPMNTVPKTNPATKRCIFDPFRRPALNENLLLPFIMDETQTRPELSQAEQVPANPPSRKRQLNGDDDTEPQTKRARTTRPISEPARLTRQNLRTLQQDGQEEVLRPPRDDSGSTKTLSTTASGFDIQAYKNGILEPSRSKPPSNLEDIHKRLARTRVTASPPESVYEEYVEVVEGAPNEATMIYQVGGKLLKEYPGKSYKKVFNQAFTGYPKDVGFNNGLSAPQPDFVEGIEMRDYHPFPVDERVPGAVPLQGRPAVP